MSALDRLLRWLLRSPAGQRVLAAGVVVFNGLRAATEDRYIRLGAATYRLTLTRRLWLGRYVTRYGPGEAREYACWAPMPFLRLERWR